MIKANLLHLSYNMWIDHTVEECKITKQNYEELYYSNVLRCQDNVWQACLDTMVSHGMNMVVIDLGNAVQYQSHPEIAVENAWTTKKLTDELARCRDLGLTPIPKLNFSSCHDAWLGKYSRMLSTDTYYQVCRDLIEEVTSLFDGPEYFHIGMDEETFRHQRNYKYCIVRQQDLWWDDLNFYVEEIRKGKSTAWVWSDVIWNCGKEIFQANMPKNVMQSNWYYGTSFSGDEIPTEVDAFRWLDEMGYQQIPTGSNFTVDDNMPAMVKYCQQHLRPSLLSGYMMADWRPLTGKWLDAHIKAVEIFSSAISGY